MSRSKEQIDYENVLLDMDDPQDDSSYLGHAVDAKLDTMDSDDRLARMTESISEASDEQAKRFNIALKEALDKPSLETYAALGEVYADGLIAYMRDTIESDYVDEMMACGEVLPESEISM